MASQRPSSPKPKDVLDPTDSQTSRVGDASKESDRQNSVDSKDSATQNQKDSGFESFDTKISLLDPLSESNSDAKEPENDLDFSPTSDSNVLEKQSEVKEKSKEKSPHAEMESMNVLLLQKQNESKPERSPNVEIVEGSALQIRGDSGNLISDLDDPLLSATITRNESSGEIDTIRYPDGKRRNFSYTDSELTGVETLETTKERTFSQSNIVKEGGSWFAELNGIKAALPGDIQFNRSGALSFELNENGRWRCERPDGIVLFENSIDSKTRIAYFNDNTIQQLTRSDGSCFECKYENGKLLEIVEHDKNGNKVTWTKVGNEWISDSKPPQKRLEFKVYPNGNISYVEEDGIEKIVTTDGTELTNSKDGSDYQLDSLGRFTSIHHNGGMNVKGVKYNLDDNLTYARVKDELGNVIHYARQEDSDSWMLTVTDDKGMVKEVKDWHGEIKLSDNGKFFLKEGSTSESVTPGQWKVFNTNGSVETVESKDLTFNQNPIRNRKAIGQNQVGSAIDEVPGDLSNMVCSDSATYQRLNGNLEESRDLEIDPKIKYKDLEEEQEDLDEIENVDDARPESNFSGSVIEARENLTELMESHLDGPQKERFNIILDRYEKRGENRIEAQIAAGQDPEKCKLEWDQKIAKSYENLASMLDPNLPGATYDLRVRAKLVESMAFAMACPVKANDQGNWGCCWMISGVFAGIIQYPDKMTDMLAQLSNTGQYTDLEGKTWTPPKGLLSITSQGGRWTIENCGGGHRSPTSEILTSVAAYLSADGRRTDRGSSGGTPSACNHAMKKITGDTWTVTSERDMVTPKMRQELLEKGAYVCIYPGHMYLGALEKHGEEWVVCASLQHGDGGRRINGTVSDLQSWTITGGRRRYNPDIDLPECQDSPTGAIGNDWPGGSTFRDRFFPNIFAPDQWPLSISFAMNLLDEGNRIREKEKAKEEEERVKKLEKERIKEERELAEIEEAKRRSRKEKEIAERKEEEELRRKKKEEERAKKRREKLKKKKLQMDLQNEEKYRKQKTLERAQALESNDAYLRKNNEPNTNRTTSRRLSEQILDLKNTRFVSADSTPSWNSSQQSQSKLDGLGLKYKPMSRNSNSPVELVSPVSEISPQLKASLENESSTQSSEKE